MWSESEIQNFKNIFLDETLCYDQNEAEKVLDESFERVRNLDFSKFQDKEEVIDKVFETLEMPTEFVAFFKDNLVKDTLVNDPGLSPEECFRNGVHIGKEFSILKKSGTKVTWNNSGKSLNKS